MALVRTGSLSDIGTLDHRRTGRGLTKGNLVYDSILLDHSTALDAETVPCSGIVFDHGTTAIGANSLRTELIIGFGADRAERRTMIPGISVLTNKLSKKEKKIFQCDSE